MVLFSLDGYGRTTPGQASVRQRQCVLLAATVQCRVQSQAADAVYPGSLNLALEHTFDWFAPRYQAHIIWFGCEEYGGERDILLLPCEVVDFERRKAFLWTPTTAARSRADPWVVELVCDIDLRKTYRLQDGDVLAIELLVQHGLAM
jgi:CTP-dependent riboflavin kinase